MKQINYLTVSTKYNVNNVCWYIKFPTLSHYQWNQDITNHVNVYKLECTSSRNDSKLFTPTNFKQLQFRKIKTNLENSFTFQ